MDIGCKYTYDLQWNTVGMLTLMRLLIVNGKWNIEKSLKDMELTKTNRKPWDFAKEITWAKKGKSHKREEDCDLINNNYALGQSKL